MYQALNSISRPKSASQKKKPTLVYTDYFKHIHKMELGKKILCWWELYISCTRICRFTEKAFRKLSKNVKAGKEGRTSDATGPHRPNLRPAKSGIFSPTSTCLLSGARQHRLRYQSSRANVAINPVKIRS